MKVMPVTHRELVACIEASATLKVPVVGLLGNSALNWEQTDQKMKDFLQEFRMAEWRKAYTQGNKDEPCN
jgi:hypothetical protein